MSEPLPFPDASVTTVYSEHFLEYLEFPSEAEAPRAEAYRVLVPGGVFSVGVSDPVPLIEAYARSDREFFAGAWKSELPSVAEGVDAPDQLLRPRLNRA